MTATSPDAFCARFANDLDPEAKTTPHQSAIALRQGSKSSAFDTFGALDDPFGAPDELETDPMRALCFDSSAFEMDLASVIRLIRLDEVIREIGSPALATRVRALYSDLSSLRDRVSALHATDGGRACSPAIAKLAREAYRWLANVADHLVEAIVTAGGDASDMSRSLSSLSEYSSLHVRHLIEPRVEAALDECGGADFHIRSTYDSIAWASWTLRALAARV